MRAATRARTVRLAWAAAPLVLAGLGVTAATGSAAPGGDAQVACRLQAERRDRWNAVPGPPGARLVDLAALATDPCRLVAATVDRKVWRSTDGGTTWSSTFTAPRAVARVLAEGLGGDVYLAYAADDGGGAATSSDGGRTFRETSGIAPGELLSVARSAGTPTGTPARTYAVVRAVDAALPSALPRATSLYDSDDGLSFAPRPGAVAIRPSVVLVERRQTTGPDRIWLDDRRPAVSGIPRGGVWTSSDGGTTYGPSENPLDADVVDLAFSGAPDVGGVLLVASPDGLFRTTDGGATWHAAAGARAVRGVRFEESQGRVLMALVGGTVVRSTDHGESFRPIMAGLPTSCQPDRLTKDSVAATQPTAFLVWCGDRAYRFRSGGADLVPPALPPLPQSSPPPYRPPYGLEPPSEPMTPLRTLPLPDADTTSSGSIAFDGERLYYAGSVDDASSSGRAGYDGRVFVMDARTGRSLGPLPSQVHPNGAIMYDARRDGLYLMTRQSMWFHDLRTHRERELFYGALLGSWSFDASTDRFLRNLDAGAAVDDMDRRGRLVGRCYLPAGVGAAAVVATGNGGFYVQSEDDRTMVRLDHACAAHRRYTHRQFSEATAENDAAACDTVTFFPKAAIWLRDAAPKSVTAYEVPDGYCPLPTRIVVSGPATVRVDGRAAVCGRLSLLAKRRPLPGQVVSVQVEGREVVTGRTDGGGRICGTYVPAATGSGGPGRKAVHASFVGSIAFGPSFGTGAVDVVPVVEQPPVRLPGIPVVLAPQPPFAPVNAPAPNAQPQPAPQPQAQIQAQAQPQPQPQGQAQANPLAAVVPVPQAQVQLAAQRDEHAMARRRRRPLAAPYPAALVATLLMSAAFATATRARTVPVRRGPG